MPTSAWVVLGLIAIVLVAYSQNTRIVQWMDQVPFLLRMRNRLASIMRPLGMPEILGAYGAMAAWVQLRIFDRLFLRYGRILGKGRHKYSLNPPSD
jgi:hypothetical protein